MAITLANTEVVLSTLTTLVGCVLHALAFFAYLYIFGVDVHQLVMCGPRSLMRVQSETCALCSPDCLFLGRCAGLCVIAGWPPHRHACLSLFPTLIDGAYCRSLSSMTLALAFVFGNSLRTVYESVVFLFIVRPYKVGASPTLARPAPVPAHAAALDQSTAAAIVVSRAVSGHL